jgi:hypothetical protein
LESGLKKPVYPEIFARFPTSLIAHEMTLPVWVGAMRTWRYPGKGEKHAMRIRGCPISSAIDCFFERQRRNRRPSLIGHGRKHPRSCR